MTDTPIHCGIIPPHVLDRLAEHEDPALAEPARRTRDRDAIQRAARPRSLTAAETAAPPSDHPQRTIYDAGHTEHLPGREVRSEGAPAVSDASVNRAYDGLGATFELYLSVYKRHSIDGRGLPLKASVHFGRKYQNAYWDGSQMVFGDGDGVIFLDFTRPVDVIGHELTHGVTQYTAGLDYQDQSGALNESISDVFGSLVKQYALGQTADQADWLIGAGLLGPTVHGVALRSMKAPGTAYDDPRLGKDPQPATMDGYVSTSDDNGGVHLNSGIPNHAFYLVASALGGNAWERAGQVWFDVLTGGSLPSDADFSTFAAHTLAAAKRRFGDGDVSNAVAAAWQAVKVPVASGALPRQNASGAAAASAGEGAAASTSG
jgi:Zn-dependent metalloprotease